MMTQLAKLSLKHSWMINILVLMAYSSQWFLLFPSTWVFKSQKFPHSLSLTSCSIIFGIYDIPSDLTMMIATIKSWRRQLITSLNFFLNVEIWRWVFNCCFPVKFIFFPHPDSLNAQSHCSASRMKPSVNEKNLELKKILTNPRWGGL